MILTGDEIVKCPQHGVRPWATARVLTVDEQGRGGYIPFYKLLCRDCGKEVRQVCRGDTAACRVRKRGLILTWKWCDWHACEVVK